VFRKTMEALPSGLNIRQVTKFAAPRQSSDRHSDVTQCSFSSIDRIIYSTPTSARVTHSPHARRVSLGHRNAVHSSDRSRAEVSLRLNLSPRIRLETRESNRRGARRSEKRNRFLERRT